MLLAQFAAIFKVTYQFVQLQVLGVHNAFELTPTVFERHKAQVASDMRPPGQ